MTAAADLQAQQLLRLPGMARRPFAFARNPCGLRQIADEQGHLRKQQVRPNNAIDITKTNH
ncbi:hypothetical protein [Sandarakinorhabdus cyanobacteriorum]|uniref:hypothetical protein n=1 Tax=Sandarakinorhabdus cyanobacteriorum TaxID=1981098 RepID=UPI00105558EC|nr:hypothetical protein [Sandarakinorhabdus cyanobacteriorum]